MSRFVQVWSPVCVRNAQDCKCKVNRCMSHGRMHCYRDSCVMGIDRNLMPNKLVAVTYFSSLMKIEVNTVKREIFASRRISRKSFVKIFCRKNVVLYISIQPVFKMVRLSIQNHHWKALNPYNSDMREIFWSRTSRRRESAKFSCREIFLFYSSKLQL